MKDIQKWIDEFLLQIKVDNIHENEPMQKSGYHAEPIIKTGKEIVSKLPQAYKEMRNIGKKYPYYYSQDAKLFYEQGMFMESYEEDFSFSEDFVQYYPSYQTLNDNQLRGYFSWRTKVRNGVVENAATAFVYIYIYELINLIGVSNPAEGYEKLIALWRICREVQPTVIGYLTIWLKDFILYYDLDLSYLYALDHYENNKNLVLLSEYKNHTSGEITAALNHFSNYNLLKSKFYGQYNEDVNTVIAKAYQDLIEYYSKNRKNMFFTKLFGYKSALPYYMFSGAIFYKRRKIQDGVKVIDSCESFRAQNGEWRHECYASVWQKNKAIGELLKTVDCLMREVYGFPYHLTLKSSSKIIFAVIEKSVNRFCEEQNKKNVYLLMKTTLKKKKIQEVAVAVPVPVVLDPEQFERIRAVAETIQKKLIVEEEPYLSIPEKPKEDTTLLSKIEIEITSQMLNNNQMAINNILKEKGLMLSVVVDSINDKLFDRIGDTVIELDGAKPIVIEDYRKELEGIINL